jgi:hypothetical protein
LNVFTVNNLTEISDLKVSSFNEGRKTSTHPIAKKRYFSKNNNTNNTINKTKINSKIKTNLNNPTSYNTVENNNKKIIIKINIKNNSNKTNKETVKYQNHIRRIFTEKGKITSMKINQKQDYNIKIKKIIKK